MSTDRAPAHSPASMQLHAQPTDSESLVSAEQVNVVRGMSLHPARQEVEGDSSAQQPELDHAARAVVEGSQIFGPAISALGSNIGAVEVAATNHNPTCSSRTSRESTQNYLSHAAPVGRRAVGMAQRCPGNPLTGPQTNNLMMPGKYYSTFVLYISAYTHSNSAGPPTTESVETPEPVIPWQDQIPQVSTSGRPPFQPTERFPRLRKPMLECRLEQMDPEELQRIIKKACEEASGHW